MELAEVQKPVRGEKHHSSDLEECRFEFRPALGGRRGD
jgi:hypothetical protein